MFADMLYYIAHFTLLLSLAGVGCVLLEYFFPAKPSQPMFRGRQAWVDLTYAYFNAFFMFGVTAFMPVLLVLFALDSGAVSIPTVFDLSHWLFELQLFVCLLVKDLAVYVRHRFMHVCLWSIHAIHHAPSEIDWLTKYRLHPVELIIAKLATVLFMLWLGFGAEVLVTAALVMHLFDIANHANVNVGFPKPFCYVLSSPNYHKWHHADEQAAVNKNFVVIFPVWDVLFGSYYYPQKAPPASYGYQGNEHMPKGVVGQFAYPFHRLPGKQDG